MWCWNAGGGIRWYWCVSPYETLRLPTSRSACCCSISVGFYITSAEVREKCAMDCWELPRNGGGCEGSWSPIMFSWWHFRSGHRVRSVSFKKYVDMIMYDQDGQGQIWVMLCILFVVERQLWFCNIFVHLTLNRVSNNAFHDDEPILL